MKILIKLLLALFISGQAYSEDMYKDLKEVCERYEFNIVQLNNVITTKNADTEIKKEGEEILQYYSKLYHYLDCSDFR